MSAPSPGNGHAAAARAEFVRAARIYVLAEYGDPAMNLCVQAFLDTALECRGVQVALMPTPKDEPREEKSRVCRALIDVVTLLSAKGRRLTTSQVVTGLAEQGTSYSEGYIKRILAAAVKDELLTNDEDADPPGYGLPAW